MADIDLQILRTASLFAGFDDEVLARFAAAATRRTYPAGEIVFVEMSDADEIFLIASGTATAELALASEDDHFDAITLGPGEIVGEIGFVEDGQRSATLVAETDLDLIVWPSTSWRGICDDDPVVGYQLMLRIAQVLCRRLRQFHERLLDAVSWGLP